MRPDPEAQFLDAFSCSLSEEQFYAFPPFSLILCCLKKIEMEEGEGIIIVPVWPPGGGGLPYGTGRDARRKF